MTPKEKAKELVHKFYQYSLYVQIDNAKQCALICVDEIINGHSWQYITKGLDYWQEVKKEIENL